MPTHVTPVRVTLIVEHGFLKRRLRLGSQMRSRGQNSVLFVDGTLRPRMKSYTVSAKSQDLWTGDVLGIKVEEACGNVGA